MRNAVMLCAGRVLHGIARRTGRAEIRDRSVLAEAAARQMDHRTHRQHLRRRARPPRRHQPARHHGGRGRDLHPGAVGADFRSRRQPRPFVRRHEYGSRRHPWLLRRSRAQHLADRQWRRHRPEVEPRRKTASADRQARRLRHDRRHGQGAVAQRRPHAILQSRRRGRRSRERRCLRRRRIRQPAGGGLRPQRKFPAPVGKAGDAAGNRGGHGRRVRAGRPLHRDEPRGTDLRLRSPGPARPGVRQKRHVRQEHLGQDRHADAAGPARHGLVDCVLAAIPSRNSCTS